MFRAIECSSSAVKPVCLSVRGSMISSSRDFPVAVVYAVASHRYRVTSFALHRVSSSKVEQSSRMLRQLAGSTIFVLIGKEIL